MLEKKTPRDVSINGIFCSGGQLAKQLPKSVTLDELKPPTSTNAVLFANREANDVATAVSKYGTDLNEVHPLNMPDILMHLVKLKIGIVVSVVQPLNIDCTLVASPKS
jgi:hypothetical protein